MTKQINMLGETVGAQWKNATKITLTCLVSNATEDSKEKMQQIADYFYQSICPLFDRIYEINGDDKHE